MTSTRAALVCVLLLAPPVGCASHGEPHGDRAAAGEQPESAVVQRGDFRWKGEIEAGKTVEVRNINGAIDVEATSGDVRIEGTRIGGHDDDVRVEAVAHEDGVTICVLYPGMKMDEEGRCHTSGGGSGHSHVAVDFRVFLPAGVRFVGRTVNGSIRTTPLDSEVEAYTVNGSIHVEASRVPSAKTVNGSIKASMVKPGGSGSSELETVNGSITLALPETIDADLSASTVSGRIRTEFPLAVRSGLGPGSSLEGRLGEGGRSIRLTTVTGTIRVARLSP